MRLIRVLSALWCVGVLGSVTGPAMASSRACDGPTLRKKVSAYARVVSAQRMRCSTATRILRDNDPDAKPTQLFTTGGTFRLGKYKCRVVEQTGSETWRASCRQDRRGFGFVYGS